MSILGNLEPKNVWNYFEEITKVPRPSKKEEKIIAFLLDFAKKNNLEAKRDKIGNVLISKPASKGMENRKSVVLQSHVDMVCEANKDTVIDFDNDPITPYIDGEWVKAKGTTLGADDGIGMAASMAILTDNSLVHGPIECLFTVDEETGLTGAFEIEEGFFKSKILLNLDSEDEGEIFIGCAGGIDLVANFDYKKENVPQNHLAYKFVVNGLQGGHSGDEIHKGFGNSNKIANRFLNIINEKFNARLSVFDGGNKRNAIPREAEFVFTIDKSHEQALKKEFEIFKKNIVNEIVLTEKNINLSLESAKTPEFVIDLKTQNNLINAVYACPHGVHAWSPAIPGFVESSNNLASVKFIDNKIQVVTSQRSSVESGKKDINNMVKAVFVLAGADVKIGDGYPGWAPNPKSEILTIAEESYERLFGKKPVVRAIHAGLECGLFLEKYPDLDMISFGPTLRGVHSPDERIEIKTVKMWYEHLLDVLKNIPKA
ncbi:MAG: aminoacyl-histidine dipeptidase [Bacteroidota bacterium]|jgi:dipeptidase D|nr:aminoacyl-histidine dipeptidase [Bacteroidales bacterium]MDI9535349.1 aminoacyl-histidine dipeptidase [Bacteroidota bacterium]OQC46493.1 MAG: Cytosol non-specific dipeptidase [Bacteroidetes bacterium ADurb.Bin028]NLP20723.1 aminoacyl-histidine dipeptidase [Bacteroidales bacterium]HNY44933.1 aminoacyl-histidine dipeptidase [Bacteroidales bacterium]